MDVELNVVALLVLAWLIGDAVIVAVALLGARAQDRRAEREFYTSSRVISPVVTLRPAHGPRRSTGRRRVRGSARPR